jgi:hypothetical protein
MEEVEETTCICQLRECPDADNAFSVSQLLLRRNISIRKNPQSRRWLEAGGVAKCTLS